MKTWLPLILVLVLFVGGCGVIVNATYSNLIDQTAAQAANDSARADANQLTVEQMKTCLRYDANAWMMFKLAKDGK